MRRETSLALHFAKETTKFVWISALCCRCLWSCWFYYQYCGMRTLRRNRNSGHISICCRSCFKDVFCAYRYIMLEICPAKSLDCASLRNSGMYYNRSGTLVVAKDVVSCSSMAQTALSVKWRQRIGRACVEGGTACYKSVLWIFDDYHCSSLGYRNCRINCLPRHLP